MEAEQEQRVVFDVDFKEEMFTIRFNKENEANKEADVGATFGEMISRTCLVGKMYSDRSFTAGMVKAGLDRAWNLKGEFRVTEKGQRHWIKIRYERLGEFCSNCGRITHPTKRCPRPRRTIHREEAESIYSFGPWLQAKGSARRAVGGKGLPTGFSCKKVMELGSQIGTATEERNEEQIANDASKTCEMTEEEMNQTMEALQETRISEEWEKGKSKDAQKAGDEELKIIDMVNSTSKKRKLGSTEGKQIVRTLQKEWVASMAEHADSIDTTAPVKSSAKRPSWKRLASRGGSRGASKGPGPLKSKL
ncbi:hypothetical protein Tsubulata_012508 [Turnera subulata]|uniref:Zinc knuckle CX2CX4HX4C domain-containing protein n=1 Tax=Turnera subulata TaxID=218843 RepID=A0A9Q0F5E6_9ROSI|nr:hypothetical protein Tsubulata_012508 [Turnera subulata]